MSSPWRLASRSRKKSATSLLFSVVPITYPPSGSSRQADQLTCHDEPLYLAGALDDVHCLHVTEQLLDEMVSPGGQPLVRRLSRRGPATYAAARDEKKTGSLSGRRRVGGQL